MFIININAANYKFLFFFNVNMFFFVKIKYNVTGLKRLCIIKLYFCFCFKVKFKLSCSHHTSILIVFNNCYYVYNMLHILQFRFNYFLNCYILTPWTNKHSLFFNLIYWFKHKIEPNIFKLKLGSYIVLYSYKYLQNRHK